MADTQQNTVVTVKLVTDRLSTILQLEVRVYITPTFDCQLTIETGSPKGLLDSGVEVASFSADDHASRLTQINLPRDTPSRFIRATIQRAKQHRDYQGRKRSRWLVG